MMATRRKRRKEKGVVRYSSAGEKYVEYGSVGDLPVPFYHWSPERVFEWLDGQKTLLYQDDTISIYAVEVGRER